MSNWSTSQAANHLRRMGVSDAIPQACGEPARSKYGAVRTQVDGHTFDSKREAEFYRSLKIANRAGLISDLVLQPRYELQAKFTDAQGKKHRAVVYVADFAFTKRTGERVAVDVKGAETQAFRIKRKLFAARYPGIKLEIWK